MKSKETSLSIEQKKQQLFPMLLFVALSFIFYGNTLQNKYSVDDEYVVYQDADVKKGLGGLAAIFTSRYQQDSELSFGYRPLGKASFAIEYQFFGANPAISHCINVLLYALLLFLIYRFVNYIFPSENKLLGLSTALIFGIMPIHTEVVASLKNREEILSLGFGLLAALYILKYIDKQHLKSLLIGLLFFILALLSKLNALVFFIIIPIGYYVKSSEVFKIDKQKIDLALGKQIRFFPYWKYYEFWAALFFFILSPLIALYIDIKPLKIIINVAVFFVPTTIYFIRKGLNKQSLKSFYTNPLVILSYLFFNLSSNPFIDRNIYELYVLAAGAPFIYLLILYILKKEVKPIQFFKSVHPSVYILFVNVLLMLIIYFTYTYLQNKFLPEETFKLKNYHNPLHMFSSWDQRFLLGFQCLWEYLYRLFYPLPFRFYYGYNSIAIPTFSSATLWFSIIIHFTLLALAFLQRKKHKALSFGIIFYLICILPFANFVSQIPGIIGERLLFFASLGFAICIAYILLLFLEKWKNTSITLSNKMYLIIGIFAVPACFVVVNRNKDWYNHLSLYSADIKHLENSVLANAMYANELLAEYVNRNAIKYSDAEKLQAVEKAAYHFTLSIKTDSAYYNGWNNLGTIYSNYLNQHDKALYCMEKALSLNPENEKLELNIMYLFEKTKQYDKALAAYDKAIAKNPSNYELHIRRAYLYIDKGEKKIALQHFLNISKLFPNQMKAYQLAGNILLEQNDKKACIELWERAHTFFPDDANLMMAISNLYVSLDDFTKAEYWHKKAYKML